MTTTQALLGLVAILVLCMAVVAVACMVVAVRVGRPRQKQRPAEPSENGHDVDYHAGRRSDSDTPTPRRP